MKKDYWRTKAGEKYYYQADGKLARNKGPEIEQTESEGSNGMVPALFANIPIKDMKQTKK